MKRRVEGLVTGVAVSSVIAAVGRLTPPADGESNLLGMLWLGILGAPVAALLGWRMAPRMERWHPVGLVAWMAVSAVMLGDLAVIVYMVVEAFVSPYPSTVFGPALIPIVALMWVMGLGYGLLVLPVTLTAASTWYVVMRVIVRSAAGTEGAPRT